MQKYKCIVYMYIHLRAQGSPGLGTTLWCPRGYKNLEAYVVASHNWITHVAQETAAEAVERQETCQEVFEETF